jgi:hypothetical protein
MPFQKVHATDALHELLTGKLPTPGNIRFLGEVFGEDLMSSLLKHQEGFNKLWQNVGAAANLPRALQASYDLSAPLRQGLFFVGRKEFYKALPGMFKAFGSEKAYQAIQSEIRSRPNYLLMKEGGVFFADNSADITNREEAFLSKFAEAVPGVRMSERGYVAFLNKLRADVADTLIEQSKLAGINVNHDKQALQAIGKLVNVGTGRGGLGQWSEAGPALNAIFFSPRLQTSRLSMLNPLWYAKVYKMNPVAGKAAVQSLASMATIAATVLGLAKLSGAQVSMPAPWKTLSSDDYKIKIGNTREDVLGGIQQYLHFVSQIINERVRGCQGRRSTSLTTRRTL